MHTPPDPGRAGVTARSLKPTVFWRIAGGIPAGLNWMLMGLSIGVPFVLWLLVVQFSNIDSRFLPGPWDVIAALGDLLQQGFLLKDTLVSCGRVGVGFGLAALVSIPLGIAMGTFASIRALTEPLVAFVRYMPAPAFIPLLTIYLGLGEAPKIVLIFIGTLFFDILMVMDAVKFVPKDLIETTYTLGGNRRQVLFQVITPHVMPSVIDTLRINMAVPWIMLTVAELIAAEEGLGKRILLAQRFFRTDEIFACLFVLGLIGLISDLLFRWLLRTTCRWAID